MKSQARSLRTFYLPPHLRPRFGRGRRGQKDLDLAHVALVAHDVVLQRAQQAFGVLQREMMGLLTRAFYTPGRTM